MSSSCASDGELYAADVHDPVKGLVLRLNHFLVGFERTAQFNHGNHFLNPLDVRFFKVALTDDGLVFLDVTDRVTEIRHEKRFMILLQHGGSLHVDELYPSDGFLAGRKQAGFVDADRPLGEFVGLRDRVSRMPRGVSTAKNPEPSMARSRGFPVCWSAPPEKSIARCASTPARSVRPSWLPAADSFNMRMNTRSFLNPVELMFARLFASTSIWVILGRIAASAE
jgi:hypothetical protein